MRVAVSKGSRHCNCPPLHGPALCLLATQFAAALRRGDCVERPPADRSQLIMAPAEPARATATRSIINPINSRLLNAFELTRPLSAASTPPSLPRTIPPRLLQQCLSYRPCCKAHRVLVESFTPCCLVAPRRLPRWPFAAGQARYAATGWAETSIVLPPFLRSLLAYRTARFSQCCNYRCTTIYSLQLHPKLTSDGYLEARSCRQQVPLSRPRPQLLSSDWWTPFAHYLDNCTLAPWRIGELARLAASAVCICHNCGDVMALAAPGTRGSARCSGTDHSFPTETPIGKSVRRPSLQQSIVPRKGVRNEVT
jgi:hypothetical protein